MPEREDLRKEVQSILRTKIDKSELLGYTFDNDGNMQAVVRIGEVTYVADANLIYAIFKDND